MFGATPSTYKATPKWARIDELFKALRAFRRLFLKPAGPWKCYLGGLRGQKGDPKDFRGALLGILGAARVPLGMSLGALWGMWRRVAA